MKKRSLLLSTALLLVAILACTSATYAWFTSNTTATVNDITASVDARSSLLISGDASAPAAGSDLWVNTLNQGDLATLNGTELLDRSSVNGSNFFSRTVNSETNAVTYASATDGIITFTLHFISSTAGDLVVKNHAFTSSYGAQEAARVAFICDGNTVIWEPSQGTTVSNDGYKSTSTGADGTRVMAIKNDAGDTEEQVQTYAALGDSNVITTLVANQSKTVTVKIWLEGQDAECANAITGDTAIKTNYQFGLAA